MSLTSHSIGGLVASVLQSASSRTGDRPKAATSGGTHRTGAPVLRNSMEAGTFEDTFYSTPAKGETDKLLRAARNLLDAGRRLRREERLDGRKLSRLEQAITRLTSGAVRVYEELATLARLNGGKVFPSYDHLEEATTLGRGTIARALNILEGVGLLVRQRRFKRVDAEGPGPRYKQTSNVYRLLLPKPLASYLPRWMRPAPVPVDQVQRDADRAADDKHMFAQLNCRELARATLANSPLGRMLEKLGASIDKKEREFDSGPQPLLNSIGIA